MWSVAALLHGLFIPLICSLSLHESTNSLCTSLFRYDFSHVLTKLTVYFPVIQLLSGDKELSILAEESGFVSEAPEQS
jgi:hypothetical protein